MKNEGKTKLPLLSIQWDHQSKENDDGKWRKIIFMLMRLIKYKCSDKNQFSIEFNGCGAL